MWASAQRGLLSTFRCSRSITTRAQRSTSCSHLSAKTPGGSKPYCSRYSKSYLFQEQVAALKLSTVAWQPLFGLLLPSLLKLLPVSSPNPQSFSTVLPAR